MCGGARPKEPIRHTDRPGSGRPRCFVVLDVDVDVVVDLDLDLDLDFDFDRFWVEDQDEVEDQVQDQVQVQVQDQVQVHEVASRLPIHLSDASYR
jgi:hypothetical protein